MTTLNLLKENFVEVFTKWKYLILTLFTFVFIFFLFFYFSDYQTVQGNYGSLHAYLLIGSQAIISFLFSLFLSLSVYKFITFSAYSPTEQSTSTIGSFLGVLVTGCTSCSITLASYLGLASLISLLPFGGLELNFLSIILLLLGTFFTLKNLKVCKFKIKKKAKN